MAGMTLRDAFAYFGAVAKSHIWSWSARSPDGATVVLTLWDDEVDRKASPVIADTYGHKNLIRWATANGNKDRISNLIHARDHCDGKFRVVWVSARDTSAIPRSILRREPDKTLVMKLEKLNEATGEYRAVSVER